MGFHIVLASDQAFFLGTEPDELHGSGWSVLCEIKKSFHRHSTAGHVVIGSRTFRHRIIMSRHCDDFLWKFSSQNADCHIGRVPGNFALLNIQPAHGSFFFYNFHGIQIMNSCPRKVTCLAAVLYRRSVLALIKRCTANRHKSHSPSILNLVDHILPYRVAHQHNSALRLRKTDVISFSYEKKWGSDAFCRGACTVQICTHPIRFLIRLADGQFSSFLLEIRALEKLHAGSLDIGFFSWLSCDLFRFLQDVFCCLVFPFCPGLTDIGGIRNKLIGSCSIRVNFCVMIHNIYSTKNSSQFQTQFNIMYCSL